MSLDDQPARVLVVDDHPDVRAAVSAMLAAGGFAVVGAVARGAEAVAVASEKRPDIVVLDIRLPDVDGIAVAEQLARLPTPPAVVLVSSRDASVYGRRLASAPVRGFIPKSALTAPALWAVLASPA